MAILQQLVKVGYITNESEDGALKSKERLKAKDILSNLNGILSVPQRKLLKLQLEHLADLKANLEEIEEEIRKDFSQFQDQIDLLDSIPGIDITAAFSSTLEITRC